MLRFIIPLLMWLQVIHGQVVSIGKCPTVDVQHNFDLNKYLGKWYEVEKYFALFEIGGKCISANYSLNQDGTVKVSNREINKLTKHAITIELVAKPAGQTDGAKFVVNFPKTPVHFNAPYWILETDYTNYSVVWSCSENLGISTKFAWILSRARKPSTDILEKANAVFDTFNLDKKKLTKTDQDNCPA